MNDKPSLQERVRNEQDAYDFGSVLEHGGKLQRKFYHVFHCPNTKFGESYLNKKIAEAVPKSVVLDYGCFNGWFCPTILSFGPKKIVGIDISKNGIQEAIKNFGHAAEYHVMDAHSLKFEDNTFDAIIGRAILHHLDFEIAIREISRVLKPGGTAIFIEPLRDNPFAKLWRFATPKARTRDELPLSRKQIQKADLSFKENAHFTFGFFSTAFGLITSLASKNPQNFLLRIAHWLDLKIAKTYFKYWMRSIVLHWKK